MAMTAAEALKVLEAEIAKCLGETPQVMAAAARWARLAKVAAI